MPHAPTSSREGPSGLYDAEQPRSAQSLRETPEPPLLSRLRAGEEVTFEEAIHRYGPGLLCVARRLLRNEEDARDALQDAFLSAFQAMDHFEGKSRVSTWLHRVVVNAALMKLRSDKRRREKPIGELLPRFSEEGRRIDPGYPRLSFSPETELEKRLLWVQVRRKIDELPESYRVVLILRDAEGLTTEEAAKALRISENAVKIRLHRARQALRTLLEESGRKISPGREFARPDPCS
jgi:RNA polymerase sigma-70 factor, ECF subfamily